MIRLRSNMGSHREVRRVFAFDAEQQNALVMYRDMHGREDLAEVTPGDLEAIDEKGRYTDAAAELQKRADYILRRDA